MTARDVLGAWHVFRAHLPLLVASECLFLSERTVRLHSTHSPLLITHPGDTKVTRTWSLLPEEETIKVDHLGQVTFYFLVKKKKTLKKYLFILCFLYKKNEHNKR